MNYTIKTPQNFKDFSIDLPTSKSESNRVLVIKALANFQKPENTIELSHLSTARDTETMQKLLNSPKEKIWDVKDAGTTMRFLTAFLAVTEEEKIITGTERMLERPIGILVDALKKLSYNIEYVGEEGYPPLRFLGKKRNESIEKLSIRGDVSSQYISALLMIAPLLPKGLTLELTGNIASKPYLQLTLTLMQKFGIKYEWKKNIIHIPSQNYGGGTYEVAPDWSAASYWYSLAGFLPGVKITLNRLSLEALQGDKVIADLMKYWGVETFVEEGKLIIEKTKPITQEIPLIDFTDFPDLAQTVVVLASAHKTPLKITGLESLRIKETDRILALQNELAKIGGGLTSEDEKIWEVQSAQNLENNPKTLFFNTYKDHRMAMAFAPLASLTSIEIENPTVVSKSYPHFWEDWTKAGFLIN